MECADPVWMSDNMKRFWNDNPSAQVLCAPCAVEHEDWECDALPGDEVGKLLHKLLPMNRLMRAIYKRE